MQARRTHLIAALALMTLGAPAARAATWRVANNGIDGRGCGLRDACRSISRAIDNAKNGDQIVVGPGIYGDIDGDSAFHSPGDERGPALGHFSVIWVNKAVRIVSEAGASATVISPGNGFAPTIVLITASGATFGELGRGFLITAEVDHEEGPDATGIRIAPGASDVEIGGNVVAQMEQGFQIYGSGHTLAFNRATANVVGFDIRALGVDLHDNTAIGNGKGIEVRSEDVSIEHSAVVGNPNGGIDLADGRDAAVSGNAVLGNPARGVRVVCPTLLCPKANIAVVANSLFGNGGASNCGIANAKRSGPLAAGQNFWGRASGPGTDPADLLCKSGSASAVTAPPAAAEITVVLPAQN